MYPPRPVGTHRLLAHVVLCAGHLVLEAQVVDGNLVAAREVLGHSRQEGLREIEARDPEHDRRTVVDPVLGRREG